MSDERLAVTIGSEEKTLPPFRGFKAIRAGRILARVTDKVQELWASADRYEEEYKKTHRIRITRAEADARGLPITFSVPDGRAASPEDYIEVPEPPEEVQVFLEVFPEALKLIEAEVVQMLALVLAPNDELRRAMDAESEGGVDGYLTRAGEQLLFDADLGQLVDVAVAARALVTREFEGKTEALSGLRSLVGSPFPSRETEEEPTVVEGSAKEETPTSTESPEQPKTQQPETREDGATTSAPTSTERERTRANGSGSSPSSTRSGPPTGGPETRSSSESPGESFAASGSG